MARLTIDSSDEDSDDDEDDTAALLQELAKIKRERAEEKTRQEREQTASEAATREAEVATANPLLNLAAALGQKPQGISTTVPGTFTVKKRWDDGQSTFIFSPAMVANNPTRRDIQKSSSHEQGARPLCQ